MNDFPWFDPGLSETARQTQSAATLVDSAVSQLGGAAVADWSGPAAESAERSAEEAQRLLLTASADLEEVMMLSAALQQEWLLGRLTSEFLGLG